MRLASGRGMPLPVSAPLIIAALVAVTPTTAAGGCRGAAQPSTMRPSAIQRGEPSDRTRMAAKKRAQEDEGTPNTQVRYFIVDLGYAEGEEFCKQLLCASDFSTALLHHFAADGSKSLRKEKLAAHVAARIDSGDVDANDFVLAYCEQPRTWLCVRFGSKAPSWPRKHTAIDLLTRREKKTSAIVWYGPFGSGNKRWYVAAQNVKHYVDLGDEGFKPYPMRWQVVAQVTDDHVSLHWNNASTREKESIQTPVQFPYWHYLDDIFAELRSMLHGEWDAEEPNLSDVILHAAFDRYVDSDEYDWHHKAVRSAYESVALNASGSGATGTREERAASGLQNLTRELATTAAKAIGRGKDNEAIDKIDRALLRKILREWGTKSYEFILHDGGEDAPLARMRVYFGADTPKDGKQTQDTIQHVHCYAKYGGSTGALKFILEEWQAAHVDDQDPGNDE